MAKFFNAPFFYKNNNYDKYIFLSITIIIIQCINNEKYPNITLKINRIGYINIIGDKYEYKSKLSLVIINSNEQNNLCNNYEFKKSNNSVDLYFYNNINNCQYMFGGCINISEINLTNFDVRQVITMSHMFYNCTKLTSLILSNFNTKKANDMSYMFSNCESINLLDLSNFNTSTVNNMSNMFLNCVAITSLDLSNFHTQKVKDMSNMFKNCKQITSLNLSNFDTSKVTNFKNIFFGCPELKYIKLKNFQVFKLNESMNFFDEVPNKVFLFGNRSIILSQINANKKSLYTIDCSDEWQFKRTEILSNMSCTCQYICSISEQCCSIINRDNFCDCKNKTNFTCTIIASELELCNKCNEKDYPEEIDALNYSDYYPGCFNKTYDDYLTNINKAFKNCNYTCEKCDLEHNNLKCNNSFSEITINNYTKCNLNCSFHYYFDYENNFQCNTDQFCPKEYSLVFENERKCIKNNFDYLIQRLTEIIKDWNNLDYKKILEKVDTIFTSENYDTSKIDSGGNEIINIGKIRIIFKALNDKKNYKNYNYTQLDFGNCTTLLRNNNNITEGEGLYLKQIEKEQDGFIIKKIMYDIYSRLSTSNLTKLNINIYKDKITMSTPIILSGNIDIFNSKSGYYSDVCYTATADRGTDIIIKDRQGEFKKGNKTICQEECDFSSYNGEEAVCVCVLQGSNYEKMTIDIDSITKKFIDISNILNIKLLVCHQILFSKEGIIRNISFYLILTLVLFHIFTIVIFFYRFIKVIRDKIKDIVFAITYWYLLSDELKNRKKKSPHFFSFYLNDLLDKMDDKITRNDKSNELSLNTKNNGNNKLKIKKTHIIVTQEGMMMNKEEIIRMVKRIMAFNDEEMNNLSYFLASKYDKRTYLQYYFSLLKTNHIILFTFYNHEIDYNSKIIKINLFFVGLIVELFVNALFFSDDTMHQIYEDEGDYNFFYQLPQIILSTLISKLFSWLLTKFALSEGNILDFKMIKSKKNLSKRAEKLQFLLRIKFIIYFIISSIFILFFWYYLSMFCAVYKNTQSHLMTDTLLSFALSLLYPLGIYLIPGIFRKMALSDNDGKKKCIYNFSIILQNICGMII